MLTPREACASLPYGQFSCADGLQYLFGVSYVPLWLRRGGLVMPFWEAVAHGMLRARWNGEGPTQTALWFYTLTDPPWCNAAVAAWCRAVLDAFKAGTDVAAYAVDATLPPRPPPPWPPRPPRELTIRRPNGNGLSSGTLGGTH